MNLPMKGEDVPDNPIDSRTKRIRQKPMHLLKQKKMTLEKTLISK